MTDRYNALLGRAMAAAVLSTVILSGAAQAADDAPNYSGSLLERDALTGDWGGARTRLLESGVQLDATFTGDSSYNARGGLKKGKGFSGLLQLGLTLDLEKLAGWTGGEVYAGAYFIRGHRLSAFEVGNLLTISNIESDRANRLGEIYFRQALFDDALTIKIGQLAADGDFATSDTAGLFVNSTFGWPGLMGGNLYSGGPAYPNPTPGVHALVKFSEEFSFQAGLYNGDPAGRNDVNDHNLGFPVDDGAFVIAEAAYATQNGLFGLPGAYKVGAWYNSLHFDDLRRDEDGQPVNVTGHDPRRRKGDYALYGVIDQTLWQGGDSGDLKNPTPGERSLSVFARAVVAPQSNRNLIDTYFDAGFNFKGPLEGRGDDIFGVSVAYAHISKDAQRADRDLADGTPIRSSEIAIEASYKAQLAPWLALQPFAQYIVRPGGGDLRPSDGTKRLRNATVLGVRTQVEF